MKFLLFADLHYGPGFFKIDGWEALRTFQKHAEETGCEMIIHAGDFCHRPKELEDIINAYNDFHIPSYHCLGNHDMDKATMEETLALYKMPNDYYFFDKGGYRFIVLNSSYLIDGDEYIPFSNGNYFNHPGARFVIPPFEVEWLKETIASSDVPCILINHFSIDRRTGIINRNEIREIIDAANEKKPHSVLMFINGHYHRDHVNIMNGVIYYDVPSPSHDWIGVPHDKYPKEECEKAINLSRVLAFNDPLHVIVTLEGTTVTVEGMKGSYYMGVDGKSIGYDTCDGDGIPLYPSAQSFKITV